MIQRIRPHTAVALLGIILLPAVAAQAADPYKVDVGHSNVIFRVKHLGVSNFYGRFNEIEGQFLIDPANPAASMIDISVPTASVDSKIEKLDSHLKSADFFSAKEFPKITFKSKSVAAGKDGMLAVTGDLSLHGVTKTITVNVEPTGAGKDPWGNERAGFECIFNIKRSDYGMKFMLDKLGDDVRLIVSMEGIRK
jgi:polyisoprenoid-binding protein YceI